METPTTPASFSYESQFQVTGSTSYGTEKNVSENLPSTLGPPRNRSCTQCCRRKVRCDRNQPCGNCVRARSECFYPLNRRPPTRHKKPNPKASELRVHLKRLGKKLESLANLDDETGACIQSTLREALQWPDPRQVPTSPDRPLHPPDAFVDSPVSSARLMLDEDRSRYVSNNFWASMATDVDEMRDILDASSSENEDDDSAWYTKSLSATPSINHESFIFNSSITALGLKGFYPSPNHLLAMFDVFLENVDPVVRIFHRPTLRTTISNAFSRLENLDRHGEVVIFSVCYAALTSLNKARCKDLFAEEQDIMLRGYRFATEQALSRAHFLDSQNLSILAALVLFLLCVRRYDNSRFVSGLLGVVIRNAQGMGLHRDGNSFNIPPLGTETRRRIWWHICVLDLRASEDHGSDPSIFDYAYDTRFPLNIDDDDISPTDKEAPPERIGISDMTFCLLRLEVSVAIRRLTYHPPGIDQEPLTAEEKLSIVESTERRFHEKYINHCDITKPLEWVSQTWARLMLAKMWLAVIHPLRPQTHTTNSLSQSERDRAFEKSIEVLELSDLLGTSPRAERWGWLFLTHQQWHAVVFVLAEICLRQHDPLSLRAWPVVDRVYKRWARTMDAKKGMLWKPIKHLMLRANHLREQSTQNSTNKESQPSLSLTASKIISDIGTFSDQPDQQQLLAKEPIAQSRDSESRMNSGDVRTGLQSHLQNAPDHDTNQVMTSAMPFSDGTVHETFDPNASLDARHSQTLSFLPEWSDWDQIMQDIHLEFGWGRSTGTFDSSTPSAPDLVGGFWNTL